MMDDLEGRLRIRLSQAGRGAERPVDPGPVPSQTPAFVGRVVADPLVPTSTGRFFSVRPVTVLGLEGEAQPGSLTVDNSSTIRVYVIGSRAPLAGDDLICRFVANRWIAEGRPSTGRTNVTLPGCFCTAISTVLRMISANPTCDGGMFQSCTLAYGDTPPELAPLALGNRCFLSDSAFTDVNGDSFRYYFACASNVFTITRVYAQSIFGSPFKDTVRYTWSIGAIGNTCVPLLLSNGRVYFGGDPNCAVTITE